MEKTNKKKDVKRIDKKLLPIKFLYFAFDAGSHGMLVYRSIYYKHLGLTSYEVGIIFLVECIFSSLMVPLVGVVADKLKKPRVVISTVITIGIVSVLTQFFIPYASVSGDNHRQYEICAEGLDNTTSDLILKFNETFTCFYTNSSQTNTTQIYSAIKSVTDNSITLGQTDDVTNASCVTATCDVTTNRVTFSTTFWLTTLMVAVSALGHRGGESTINSSVLQHLGGGEQKKKFGKQLMWAAMGGAIMIGSVGCLKDFVERTRGQSDRLMFLPMFLCNGFFWVLAVATVMLIPFKHGKTSSILLSDIKKVVWNIRSVALLIVLWSYGVDQAMLANYLFWYAETKLQASGTILGISVLVGTVFALPVFAFNNKVIKKLGCDVIISFTMVSFAVRFFLYTIINQSWMLIPMEIIFRPISYALAWTTICIKASNISPKGLEATTMAIVYTTTKIIGSGTGAAISGKIFLDYGGDFLFHSMALMSLVAGISYQCFILVANKTKKKNVNNNQIEDKNTKLLI